MTMKNGPEKPNYQSASEGKQADNTGAMEKLILNRIHDGHFGIVRCAGIQLWWPRISEYIKIINNLLIISKERINRELIHIRIIFHKDLGKLHGILKEVGKYYGLHFPPSLLHNLLIIMISSIPHSQCP
ncbi:hypothetical protein LAZ67_4002606 [Cordylochernes scorpioides]|uniref:Uncharacterized protein n=1 Tax=Cordylochernes scorpioides TaxID=51811 RepID=A0ABY6KE58_9ARAC|nr:hypothetical protein LAZ67_4002606 [Cordylochernes scorpioides]